MILAIDTSLGTAVAVVEADGLVRAEASSDNPLGHAEVIGELLQKALADAAFGPVGATTTPEPVDVAYVAVGMGPGPFTGLRVGIAAARAFALGRAVPVVPVPSHDAVALGIVLEEAMTDAAASRFAVVTDARRKEFAYTVYEGMDDDGLPVRVTEPALVPRDEIDAVLAELGARRRDAASVSAAMVGIVADRAIAADRQVATGEPLYLRAPDVTMPGVPKRVGT